jgi:hypothetical protein
MSPTLNKSQQVELEKSFCPAGYYSGSTPNSNTFYSKEWVKIILTGRTEKELSVLEFSRISLGRCWSKLAAPTHLNSGWDLDWVLIRVFLKSHPVFTLSLGLFSPPIPSLSQVHKVRKFLLNLGMKCWKLSIYCTRFKVIIAVVQVWAVQISVVAVEALRKNERGGSKQDETGAFLSFTPLNAKGVYGFRLFRVLFCSFLKIPPGFGPNSGFWCCVFLTLRKTLLFFDCWNCEIIKLRLLNSFY